MERFHFKSLMLAETPNPKTETKSDGLDFQGFEKGGSWPLQTRSIREDFKQIQVSRGVVYRHSRTQMNLQPEILGSEP